MSEQPDNLLEGLVPFMTRVGQHRRFAPGGLLIEQGRHDQQIYYILSGTTQVTRDGNPIRTVQAGDLVGEYAFIDNRPRTASVTAIGEVEVLEIDRQTLIQSANEDLALLSQFLQVATQRMQKRFVKQSGGQRCGLWR